MCMCAERQSVGYCISLKAKIANACISASDHTIGTINTTTLWPSTDRPAIATPPKSVTTQVTENLNHCTRGRVCVCVSVCVCVCRYICFSQCMLCVCYALVAPSTLTGARDSHHNLPHYFKFYFLKSTQDIVCHNLITDSLFYSTLLPSFSLSLDTTSVLLSLSLPLSLSVVSRGTIHQSLDKIVAC